MDTLQKIAVLIDADNTPASKLEAIFKKLSTYGRIVVKRAYGNWEKSTLSKWENETKRLAVKAVQQFDYTTGKNAPVWSRSMASMTMAMSVAFFPVV